MRLLIPHAYNVRGGVEKTAVSLVREFAKLLDRVIFALPENQIPYFQSILPPSGKLVYEPLAWPADPVSKIIKRIFGDRLRYLARRHRATHCLYPIINGQHVPNLNIPVAGILYDVYWHALQNLPEKLVKERDGNLKEWLEKADTLFAISETTKRDALKLFPTSPAKIKAVPLAFTEPSDTLPSHPHDMADSERIFYYPSAHCSYQKNHLALFKAAVKLAEKGLQFRIIVSGIGTNDLSGSAPLKDSRIEPARDFYNQNREMISGHVDLRGDCPPKKIEELYGSCSCVVLPSIFEGFGLPLSDAVSRGIPVICSDLDVFKEQAALYHCEDLVQFFPATDADALAKCMDEFIRQPRGRAPSDEVKKRFSHWTWADVATGYIRELEGIAHPPLDSNAL